MHYLLFYEIVDDYASRRARFRDEHLEKSWAASERGELILGGALADPLDGAVLLFQADSPELVENFAKADPYVTNGLVKRWYIRKWNTVAGEDAASPIRPPAAPPANKGTGILRLWKARAAPEKASAYVEHVTRNVFPAIRSIEGHRGVYLLRRALDGAVEFVVLTLWESMDAVRRFAGAQPDKAVVEPPARAVLDEYDEFVTHFEIVNSDITADARR